MEPTQQDKLAAATFEAGLAIGFLRREDLVGWADRRVQELEYAPEWLAELSLGSDRPLNDVLNALKNLAAGMDGAAVFKGILGLLPDREGISFDTAESRAIWVYEIARHLIGDWQHELMCGADEVANAFSLVRSGHSAVSRQQTIEQLARFIEDNRDQRLQEALYPTTWKDPESHALAGLQRNPGHPIVHVGLSSWIIQDGNYGDFTVGQEAKFALEFYPPHGLKPAQGGPTYAGRIAGARYLVQAQVVFAQPDAWVIDAGSFLAYYESKPPPHALKGTWVEGEISLGIDPFFYFERLHQLDGMPALTYRWLVRSIERETTPWIQSQDAQKRPYWQRDERRESFLAARQTDAWHEDDGNAHYVLQCERLSGPEMPGAA